MENKPLLLVEKIKTKSVCMCLCVWCVYVWMSVCVCVCAKLAGTSKTLALARTRFAIIFHIHTCDLNWASCLAL